MHFKTQFYCPKNQFTRFIFIQDAHYRQREQYQPACNVQRNTFSEKMEVNIEIVGEFAPLITFTGF